MPRTPKTPQQKKRLSLKKDRRNTYGEHAKSSRKNIARNKTYAHQEVRAKARAALDKIRAAEMGETDVMETTLTTPRLQKGRWRKSADRPLGLVIENKLKRRKHDTGARQRRRARQIHTKQGGT